MNSRHSQVTETEVSRALEKADLNVLRVSLYQQTGDPALARMPMELRLVPGTPYETYQLARPHAEELKAKALAYLMAPDPPTHLVPSFDEVRKLVAVFAGRPVPDSVAVCAHEELAFAGFQRAPRWSNGTRPLTADFNVLIIGAGFSAIVAAVQLSSLGIPYRIIERQRDFGGTWQLNDYPDARVDITSFIYSFTFERYPWKHAFAPRDELMEYIGHLISRFDIRRHATFDTHVTSARWDEPRAKWLVDVEGSDGARRTLSANVLLSAAGLFSTARRPDIPGIESFRGRMFHTTEWDHDYDLSGKRVALIGTGSTGSQLLPRVAEWVEHIAVYQRTPNWVTPVGAYRSPIPGERQWLLRNMPAYSNWNRYSHFEASVRLEPFQCLDPEWRSRGGRINAKNDQMREWLTGRIRGKVASRPDLTDRLIPEFAPLSRRLVVDNGWYDALLRDNVDLVTDPIERITSNGIRTTSGDERRVDLIILASGFHVERYLSPVEYVGRDGATLEDLWSHDGARAYLTMTLPAFPNFFMMYGPNAGVRAGSFHSAVELLSRYICQIIVGMVERGARSAEIRKEVYAEYNRCLDARMKHLLWEEEKGGFSYYLNRHGKSGVNMPWTTHDFYDWIRNPNLDEFVFRD